MRTYQPVVVTEHSRNAKTGATSTTYAPWQTCPKTCPFFGAGCYGEQHLCGITFRGISKAADGMSVAEIAQAEADAIRRLSGKRHLRLHVTGDCPTDEAARIISDACHEHIDKAGKSAWAYTHAWRTVSRSSWGSVSVLASCETQQDVIDADALGYAVAIAGSGLQIDGWRMVPCPAETHSVTCVECRLCFHADLLHHGSPVTGNKTAIVFEPHGCKRRAVQATIDGLRASGE